MNQALQPKLHPDAESLNAFMEQALPQPERAQIVEHIATCRQCRQIVFLSQQAAVDAQVTASITSRPQRRVRNWRLNWRLAWAPAAVFAAIVVLAITLRVWHAPDQGQMARLGPPTKVAPSQSSPPAPAAEAAVRRPATTPILKAAKKSPTQAQIRESIGESASPSNSYGGFAGEIGAASHTYGDRAQTASAPGSASFGQGIPANAAAEPQPEPAVAAWQTQQSVASELSMASKAPRVNEAGFRAKPAASQSSRNTAQGGAAASGMASKSALSGGFEPSPPKSATVHVTAPQSEAFRLPSGLAPVSIATAQHRTVAIDSAGSLFVRESSSADWEPVDRQWSGHLVQVREQRHPQAGAAGIAGASPDVATAFEILNDANLVWISQDGKIWKAP